MCIARPRHHRFEISNRKFQFPAISRTVGAQWNKHRLSSYGNRRIERYEKSEKIIQRYYMFLGCIKLIFLFHASSNLFFFFFRSNSFSTLSSKVCWCVRLWTFFVFFLVEHRVVEPRARVFHSGFFTAVVSGWKIRRSYEQRDGGVLRDNCINALSDRTPRLQDLSWVIS